MKNLLLSGHGPDHVSDAQYSNAAQNDCQAEQAFVEGSTYKLIIVNHMDNFTITSLIPFKKTGTLFLAWNEPSC